MIDWASSDDSWEMGLAVPEHSRAQVDKAGARLAKNHSEPDDGLIRAVEVVNNWRASHTYPLNVFQMTLRNRAKTTYPSAVVTQRLKRIVSIEAKLRNLPGMQLSRMQDIGGCRAVVATVTHVDRLANKYKETGYHEYVREFDYLRQPKTSGYRGIHLIYRYHAGNERSRMYDKLSIEIQLRSRHQHAWATAVEAVDTFTGQALKAGHGNPAWERFFALMGTVLARLENTQTIPGTPTTKAAVRRELAEAVAEVNAVETLKAYRTSIAVSTGPALTAGVKPAWFVLLLDFDSSRVTMWSYETSQMETAIAHLAKLEEEARERPTMNVVLVGAESMKAVRRAYPNYFLDTGLFIEEVQKALGRRQ